MTEKMNGVDFAAMFAAGAASVASDMQMNEKDAEAFVGCICKQAAGRKNVGDGDEEYTFWERNKRWLIPTIVGSLAFYAGASGERHGRPDRGYLSNSWHNLWDRVKTLFGYDHDPIYKSLTNASGDKDGYKDVEPVGHGGNAFDYGNAGEVDNIWAKSVH